MSLLLDGAALARRRAVAQDQLEPLLASLGRDLEWMLDAELYIPKEKALLSRTGGRCPRDGTLLDFDPRSPHAHRCLTCGETFSGELHDRFWIYWYQLWLAERAVHAALVGSLAEASQFTTLGVRILDAYASAYTSFPNEDNVLGPSRLFFSTYLESIWLLQICVATDVLEMDGDASIGQRVRDRIIEPARAIISVFDEGQSNRQVWNNAALFAAARLVGDAAAVDRLVGGPSGLLSHLTTGLLSDGTWFEGDNYHLFAHRGLWYGVTMARVADLDVPANLERRFREGFATPFLTALPDFTLPSRRDSPYAVSLRQWRAAEHVELGLALGGATEPDARLLGALYRLYRDDVPRVDTGRSRSSADVERNGPPTALSRSDLSWRALVHALPGLPPLAASPAASVLLEQQGLAVFRRRSGNRYVALDYGASGGGHGHPDRLNLLIVDGSTRWLDDYGTGSYVDPSLHWYRSTLAHNAPLVDGRSQQQTDGALHAFDEQPEAGWIDASALIAPGVKARRSVVVMQDYVLERFEWEADRDVTLDLPRHVDLALVLPPPSVDPAMMIGSEGSEDGFRFLEDTACQKVPAATRIHATGRADSQTLDAWTWCDRDTEWWHAVAPGPPVGFGRGAPTPFHILRARGQRGVFTTIWSFGQFVTDAAFGEVVAVKLAGGAAHTHRAMSIGWQIELGDEANRRITLSGVRKATPNPRAERRSHAARPVVLTSEPREFELGEAAYARSEDDWHAAGRPTATVRVAHRDHSIIIDIDVPRSERSFVPADAENPFDNEPADINGDGVQLYVEAGGARGAWLLMPEANRETVRVRRIEAWPGLADPRASWSATREGYAMHIEVQGTSTKEFRMDVLINEKPSRRSRRRGQLVLSGARGSFIYLKGDRHDPEDLLTFRVHE